jgi:hypothetical protein
MRQTRHSERTPIYPSPSPLPGEVGHAVFRFQRAIQRIWGRFTSNLKAQCSVVELKMLEIAAAIYSVGVILKRIVEFLRDWKVTP